MTWRLPRDDERTAVIGRTGSGKTRLSAFLLSHASYHKRPWVIVDYKGEPLFDKIRNLQDIGYGTVPRKPGLYRLTPSVREADAVEDWMLDVHAKGGVGLYFDETLQVPGHYKNGAFKAILTQGRSKKIPCILCSQRPSGVSPSVFSEADHLAIFSLNREQDIKAVSSFTPDKLPLRTPLPPFHSWWYDVKADQHHVLAPAEPDSVIIDRFNERLKRRFKFL